MLSYQDLSVVQCRSNWVSGEGNPLDRANPSRNILQSTLYTSVYIYQCTSTYTCSNHLPNSQKIMVGSRAMVTPRPMTSAPGYIREIPSSGFTFTPFISDLVNEIRFIRTTTFSPIRFNNVFISNYI